LSTGFPMNHQPRLCVTPSSPRWGSDTQILLFCRNFYNKKH